jgi:hypothetical protein
MPHRLLSGVIPFEIVVTVDEIDVFFVEDGGPLEGCGCGRADEVSDAQLKAMGRRGDGVSKCNVPCWV